MIQPLAHLAAEFEDELARGLSGLIDATRHRLPDPPWVTRGFTISTSPASTSCARPCSGCGVGNVGRYCSAHATVVSASPTKLRMPCPARLQRAACGRPSATTFCAIATPLARQVASQQRRETPARDRLNAAVSLFRDGSWANHPFLLAILGAI